VDRLGKPAIAGLAAFGALGILAHLCRHLLESLRDRSEQAVDLEHALKNFRQSLTPCFVLPRPFETMFAGTDFVERSLHGVIAKLAQAVGHRSTGGWPAAGFPAIRRGPDNARRKRCRAADTKAQDPIERGGRGGQQQHALTSGRAWVMISATTRDFPEPGTP